MGVFDRAEGWCSAADADDRDRGTQLPGCCADQVPLARRCRHRLIVDLLADRRSRRQRRLTRNEILSLVQNRCCSPGFAKPSAAEWGQRCGRAALAPVGYRWQHRTCRREPEGHGRRIAAVQVCRTVMKLLPSRRDDSGQQGTCRIVVRSMSSGVGLIRGDRRGNVHAKARHLNPDEFIRDSSRGGFRSRRRTVTSVQRTSGREPKNCSSGLSRRRQRHVRRPEVNAVRRGSQGICDKYS